VKAFLGAARVARSFVTTTRHERFWRGPPPSAEARVGETRRRDPAPAGNVADDQGNHADAAGTEECPRSASCRDKRGSVVTTTRVSRPRRGDRRGLVLRASLASIARSKRRMGGADLNARGVALDHRGLCHGPRQHGKSSRHSSPARDRWGSALASPDDARRSGSTIARRRSIPRKPPIFRSGDRVGVVETLIPAPGPPRIGGRGALVPGAAARCAKRGGRRRPVRPASRSDSGRVEAATGRSIFGCCNTGRADPVRTGP
jgi:hypothetical protein